MASPIRTRTIMPLRDTRLGNATATAALAAQLGFPQAAQTGSPPATAWVRVAACCSAVTRPGRWCPSGATTGCPEARHLLAVVDSGGPVAEPANRRTSTAGRRDPQTGRVKATGTWMRVSFAARATAPGAAFYNPYHPNDYWLLESITLNESFDGSPLVLPQVGRNSYAFLNNLSQEALLQVQSAFDRSATGRRGQCRRAGACMAPTPCTGHDRDPQAVESADLARDQLRTPTPTARLAGMKGRFGSDWRWDAYYQYGGTDSTSIQPNNATNLRLAFALDAVIDDRPTVNRRPTAQPICRILRDGAPVLDTQGRPITGPDSLAALAADCKPLNMFGTALRRTGHLRRHQLRPTRASTTTRRSCSSRRSDYAFVDSRSSGTVVAADRRAEHQRHAVGWLGAGPLTPAFGLELRENKTDNAGTAGRFLRARRPCQCLGRCLRRPDAGGRGLHRVEPAAGLRAWMASTCSPINARGPLRHLQQQGWCRHHRRVGHAEDAQLEVLGRRSSPSTGCACA